MTTESLLIARIKTEGATKATDELKNFTAAAKSAATGSGSLGSMLSKLPGPIKAALSIGSIAKGMYELGQMAINVADQFDDLTDRATRLGISVKELQVMEDVFARAGVGADQASEMILGFEKSVNMAVTAGKGPLAKTLKAMEGQVKLVASEFVGLSGKEGMQLFIQKMEEAGLAEQQQKAYLEQVASGASKLYDMLKDNAKGYDELTAARERAQKAFGVDIIDQQKLLELDDAVKTFGSNWEEFTIAFAADIAPAVRSVVELGSTSILWFSRMREGWKMLMDDITGASGDVINNRINEIKEELSKKPGGVFGVAYPEKEAAKRALLMEEWKQLQQHLDNVDSYNRELNNAKIKTLEATKKLDLKSIKENQATINKLKADNVNYQTFIENIEKRKMINDGSVSAIRVKADRTRQIDEFKTKIEVNKKLIAKAEAELSEAKVSASKKTHAADLERLKKEKEDREALDLKFKEEAIERETEYWATVSDIRRYLGTSAIADSDVEHKTRLKQIEDFGERLKATTRLTAEEIQYITSAEIEKENKLREEGRNNVIKQQKTLAHEINRLSMTDSQLAFDNLITAYEQELEKLEENYNKKLISYEQYLKAKDALTEQYVKGDNKQVSDQYQQDLSDYASFTSSMGSLMTSWEHGSEEKRKKAFRAQKAFSIATASINMSGAIAKAMDDWEGGSTAGRFALAAGVAVAFGNLISNLQSTDYQGARAQGGQFNSGTYLVGEKGPELVRFGGSGRIADADQTRSLMSGSAPSVTIINQTTGKIDKTEQQFDEGRLVITIQEVMERETLAPNSRFNKAFSRTRKTQRTFA